MTIMDFQHAGKLGFKLVGDVLQPLWIWNGFVSQVGLLNVNGYYDPLLMFVDNALNEGVLNDAARCALVSAPTPKELVDKMVVSKREKMVPLVANFTKI